MKNDIHIHIKLFQNLFWNSLKQARYNLISWVLIIIVLLFVWILGFHIDLQWENEKIVKSTNSIWFGGDINDYKLGFSFAYFFMLVASIFFSSKNNYQVYHLSSATFWLTLPIKREYLILSQLLSQALILGCFFILLQTSLWFILGMRYEVWLFEFFEPIFIMFLVCLLISLITSVFTLILSNDILTIFFSLFFMIFYPLIEIFINKSTNIYLYDIFIFGFILESLDIKLLEFLLNGANFITEKNIIDISDLIDLVFVFIILFVCNLLLFKRKYY